MNIKGKLVTGVATIAVGAMASIGGTFAYFSDEVESASTFTNGIINLQPEKASIQSFEISNWKPGDVLEANTKNQEPAMVLRNLGTLPFNVFMDVTVSDEGEGSKDAIVVKVLKFGGENLLKKYDFDANNDGKVTLSELDTESAGDTTVNGKTVSGVGKYIGYLDANDKDPSTSEKRTKFVNYVLEFEDSGTEQNSLMGEETSIDFKFTALQYEGETFSSTNGNIDNQGSG
ncbi:TasA family protein, partial [Ammoniphilus sp. CFH 90114]|uniref:TasA family protein n=1 Tax=Ammoniphilus sp. CFH 90114 TaxID=2493665 RepID=UPI00100FD9AB